MSPDPYADLFRFRIGDVVRSVESPTERYYVAQRRWTEREYFEPLMEYRLRLGRAAGVLLGWVRDDDVMRWIDEPRP